MSLYAKDKVLINKMDTILLGAATIKTLRRPLPWNRRAPDPATITDHRLRQAAESFFELKTKLKVLAHNLEAYHADDGQLATTREKLVSSLAEISRGSPIADLMLATIAPPMEINRASEYASKSDKALVEQSKVEEQTEKSRGKQDKLPYQAVHAAAARRLSGLQDIRQEMLTYVGDWDRTITQRICTELRLVKALENSRAKYEVKVNNLRASVGKVNGLKTSVGMARNDKKEEELASKIARNETKLRRAAKEYRNNLINVTLLVEEATQRGWRDLIPLINKMIKNDIEATRVNSSLEEPLLGLWEEIEVIASRFDMTLEDITNGRLKLLRQEDATTFVRAEDMEDIDTVEVLTLLEYGVPKRGSSSSNDGDPSGVFRSSDNGLPRRIHALERTDELRSPANSVKSDTGEDADEEWADVGRNIANPVAMESSFFVVCNSDNNNLDDELTTLTPYTRCERRISI